MGVSSFRPSRLSPKCAWGGLPCLLALILFAGNAAAAQQVVGTPLHHAALVVRHGDGRVVTRVVAFSTESISGLELLERASLEAEIDYLGLGGAVAALQGEGCHPPGQSAFCQCQGAECKFWRYFHLDPGPPAQWRLANSGAGDYRVRDGAVEGWAWGGKEQPPLYSFTDLYQPPPPTATRASTRPSRPSSTPTRTAQPATTTPTPALATAMPRPSPIVGQVGLVTTTAQAATATPSPQPSSTPQPSDTPAAMLTASLVVVATTTPGVADVLPMATSQPPGAYRGAEGLAVAMILLLVLLLLVGRGATGEPLNSRAWLGWLLAAVLAVGSNPYYLAMLLLTSLIVYRGCAASPGGQQGSVLLRLGVVSFAFIALFNFLTAHAGRTVLLTLPREWPAIGGILTAEGLAWGASKGLTILTLLAVFATFNRVVSHREVLSLIPGPMRRLGLVASIAVLFVPQTVAAAQNVQQAQQLRGYRVRARNLLPLFAPLLLLSLEQASQLAEALATRAWGYGPPGFKGRTAYRHLVWRPRDRLLLAVGLAVATSFALLRLFSSLPLDYYPYPQLQWPPFDLLPALLTIALLLPPALVSLSHARQPDQTAASVLQRSEP